MDSRQVGHAIRRRAGVPLDVYGSGHRTEDARLLAQEQERLAAETPFAGPNGTLPPGQMRRLPGTIHGSKDEQSGERSIVHHSIPMGTDYRAIEDAFDARSDAVLRRHRGSEGGWGNG